MVVHVANIVVTVCGLAPGRGDVLNRESAQDGRGIVIVEVEGAKVLQEVEDMRYPPSDRASGH